MDCNFKKYNSNLIAYDIKTYAPLSKYLDFCHKLYSKESDTQVLEFKDPTIREIDFAFFCKLPNRRKSVICIGPSYLFTLTFNEIFENLYTEELYFKIGVPYPYRLYVLNFLLKT